MGRISRWTVSDVETTRARGCLGARARRLCWLVAGWLACCASERRTCGGGGGAGARSLTFASFGRLRSASAAGYSRYPVQSVDGRTPLQPPRASAVPLRRLRPLPKTVVGRDAVAQTLGPCASRLSPPLPLTTAAGRDIHVCSRGSSLPPRSSRGSRVNL